jgi:hypothetical protein
MTLPLLATERRWYCPKCRLEDVTNEPRPHTRFHPCRSLNGLATPMVETGTRAKIEVREREDYVGKEKVRLHDGRPVMALITTRDDGQDVTVFAPTATLRGDANGGG